MPDINGIPYVESDDLVSAYPAVSQSLAQEVSDQLASKLPYSFGTAEPASPGDGELWVDTSGAPNKPSVKFYDGSAFQPVAGLTLITTETFSAVSSVSINGCFTSTYTNYRIAMRLTGTANVALRYRNRLAGSDAATNYDTASLTTNDTTISANRLTSQTQAVLGAARTTLSDFYVDISGVSLAQITGIVGVFGDYEGPSATGISVASRRGIHTTATAYDGFSIFPDSGTITGTIRVYGYKD